MRVFKAAILRFSRRTALYRGDNQKCTPDHYDAKSSSKDKQAQNMYDIEIKEKESQASHQNEQNDAEGCDGTSDIMQLPHTPGVDTLPEPSEDDSSFPDESRLPAPGEQNIPAENEVQLPVAGEIPESSVKTKASVKIARPKDLTDSTAQVKSVRKSLRSAISWAFLGLSVFSVLYWIVCAAAAGTGISALYIWPFAAIFFAVCRQWTAGRFPFSGLKKKRWLRHFVALLLLVVFLLFCIVELLIFGSMGADGEPDLDYIIVLGAHVRGTVPSSALLWRIEKACEYLSENPDTMAVLSGGQGTGEEISEAECMRRELVKMGIDESRLLLEDRSTSTYENISYSLEIIGDKNAKIGIVTNNFHVWRATKTARSAGVQNPSGISAPYRNLLVLHYMVREFFSIVANRISGNI